MQDIVDKKKVGRTRLTVLTGALIATPFMAGALMLGWQAAMLPDAAGKLALARLLGAALFSFGFAIALVSSVVALSVRAPDRRTLATAGLLLGASHIALGFVVRRTIEDATMNYTSSLLPVILPILLWAASIWLAISSTRTTARKDPQDAPVQQSPAEEQPQLLLPP